MVIPKTWKIIQQPRNTADTSYELHSITNILSAVKYFPDNLVRSLNCLDFTMGVLRREKVTKVST